ncbi:hypothetical protein T10_9369 [Trichinella papuae]|uniref:Uncharacterized protein n=1 Tax=Trichinella papuae TaxID=268474 RepID=A0A0V1M0I9_9BILA|nr:hypothetical protein T10_9369 [Trichinella papuae]
MCSSHLKELAFYDKTVAVISPKVSLQLIATGIHLLLVLKPW